MQVKVISKSGSSILVEWVDSEGTLYRSRVPAFTVTETGGKTHCENPEEGIPYGEPWAELAKMQLDSELLERTLHRSGIWTLEDYVRDPQAVLDAFRTAYSMDAQKLRDLARLR